jgi:fermentation-respiration switch protein FrsA (DUF1100 family)
MTFLEWIVLVGCMLVTPPVPLQNTSWQPLRAFETAMVFHPATANESWEEFPVRAFRDVWLQTADGVRIHAWWLPMEGATGAVLYCHGNAGNLSHRGFPVFKLANGLRESVLIFDYPGYGKSAGAPSEAGCYAAALAAYDWLTVTKQIPSDRIVLFGESLGGGVATELAIRRPQRALVLVKTFTSVPNMARQSWFTSASAALVRNEFDNLAKIGRCPAPIFIAHGDRDEVIPLTHGQQLYKAAPSPKNFCLLKGSRHNDPLPDYFIADLCRFLSNAASN